VLNCGATSDELLAAELFGYVEGAFTGAAKGGKKGKLELAHGGTLFLDEVETMSPRMQVSLLRVLEEGLVTRVGADRPLMVDVRIIAASNEDLQAATREKRFRLDLYHRLSSFPLTLPPLRARIEDLPLLAQHLLGQLGFPHLQLAPAAEALLARYSWPGNVRELKNVLRRAAHLANGTFITPAQLPQEIHLAAAGGSLPIAGSLRDTERELILRALDAAAGDVTRAAVQLGIHRATLYRKLKKYRLSAPRGLKDGCVLRSEGNGEA
jgi:transcriptional regulator with PAS, ATPase and Fis domain